MESPLQVGIIGAGGITEYIHAPLVESMPAVELAYIADIDPKQVSKLRDFGNVATVIEEPADLPQCDVSVLAIPVGVRQPYHTELARRETPVFVEKPFAVDSDEHEQLCRKNEQLFCDYMRVCFSSTQQLRSIVAHEPFGALEKVSLQEQGRAGATGIERGSYHTDPNVSGGGVLLERGCHPLSQLISILPNQDLELIDARVEFTDNIDTEVEATLGYHHEGTTIPIEFLLSSIHPIEDRTRFVFEHAEVSVDQKDPSGTLSIRPRSTADTPSAVVAGETAASTASEATTATSSSPIQPLSVEPTQAWANENTVAFYLRWKQFISFATGELDQSVLSTAPEVTELISAMYERG